MYAMHQHGYLRGHEGYYNGANMAQQQHTNNHSSRRSGHNNGANGHQMHQHHSSNGVPNGHNGSRHHHVARSLNMKERPPLLRDQRTGNEDMDTVLNQFRETLYTLTWQPDLFDHLVPYLVSALNCGKVKMETSEKLAHILVTWVSCFSFH